MTVIGLNLGATALGKPLKDGGAAIFFDGGVKGVVAEERVARRKKAGGFAVALPTLLERYGISLREKISIVQSTCCEPPRQMQIPQILNAEYHVVNHHMSHAASVYFSSPFDEALILVADAGGNVLESAASANWWHQSREQTSLYLARGSEINLLGRDFSSPFDMGLGEFFRAVTYALGWPSGTKAGKVMATAGLPAESPHNWPKAFAIDAEGKVRSNLRNDPPNAAETLISFLRSFGVSIDIRHPGGVLRDEHIMLAKYAQQTLVDYLVARIGHYLQMYPTRNVCLAGGVAYNCLAVEQLKFRFPGTTFFLHPGSGDEGQCVGNAYLGALLNNRTIHRHDLFNPFLGLEYSVGLEDIPAEIKSSAAYRVHESQDISSEAAHLLSLGSAIGWFQGRSEYGPRSLGNRSILADPRTPEMKARLNSMKGREPFMPFAPAVIYESARRYFDLEGPSPYMAIAANALPEGQRLGAIVHADNSARVQTVHRELSPRFYRLLQEFQKRSGVPILLNTSFNAGGQAIVENPPDAIAAFIGLKLDALCIGDIIVQRRQAHGR